MTPSPQFYANLEREEGCVLHPYLDVKGVPTIGIGTTIYPDTGRKVTMRDPAITREKAEFYVRLETNSKVLVMNHLLSPVMPMAAGQFDSLASFTYNVGIGGFRSSRLLRCILSRTTLKVQTVDTMDDPQVAQWMRSHSLRAVPMVTYCFALWCKITVEVQGVPTHIISQNLIERRMREAKQFLNS